MIPEGYFMDRDDGHFYIIPTQYRQEWFDGLNSGNHDELPEFADPLGRPFSSVIFKEYEIV